ncbi:tRNA (N6-threonylcarbamoyladenosine(37)-N6)-methyltransferase TrmO [Neisseria leonii]|uniref:tRNA (N6-threonylcarbamoyladenosine(37)-N6)-methyltransferase TrmO n=1 Tax=Neisseria leonii TaxID=2995413 RepID=UPI00237ADF45|nr:tRNA (N6-threonylcarbamoyladenosine(37)-N6)-methyltransferase TrmO [Neisseria sp. 3986]MDD9326489.1 tRNA (N6-threonylcarbamoyladenosine(37)-N6)-methyltransferase TrmO [Neisseria sp. 3986]
MEYTIQTIGSVHSPYRQKFGVARQPGLVPAAAVCIELNPDFHADSVRGLADFDYIWLHFIFHGVLDEGWAPMVRPPRLGGKRKMGVFATRSPHRPNHLGLSLLKLERIESSKPVRIWCSGADLIDGTPVIDIKPYIPFIEAKPQAKAGFVSGAPQTLNIRWQNPACRDALPSELVALIEQSIAQDPRPAYQDIPERRYGMALAGYQIHFHIVGKEALIVSACAGETDQQAV